ncbi:hypothetical protein HK101_006817 [Irineochytrium annulatum]|nr:hypothetical protein HK101_006817 [Irineochytrium annulatum]
MDAANKVEKGQAVVPAPTPPPDVSQHRRLTMVVMNSRAKPYTVNEIRIEGIRHTRSAFVERLIQPVMKSETLGEILDQTQALTGKLRRLGIFKSVGVQLDLAQTGRDEKKKALDIVLELEESPRLYARTSTAIGTNEGDMTASINIRNAFGNGETIETNATYGMETNTPLHQSGPFASQTGTSFKFMFNKPLEADPDKRLEFRAMKLNRNLNLYSSHDENVIEGSAAYKDLRNDLLLPTQGTFFKSYQEFAGLGGDVKHYKAEVEGQLHIPVGNGFSWSFSGRGGLLHPLNGLRSRINDRFFIGGPGSVRGFRHNGLGPKEGGGDAYFSGGVSLFTPLPYLVDQPLKGHIFANAGNLVPMQPGRVDNTFRSLFNSFSSSVGMGIAVRFSILRLEINYCLPLTVTTTDAVKPGFNFAVGMAFL